ncbi:MAG: heat-inducible transcription repressor HrcA [Firmicutes bacterium]|nr:heat-inducible transcription repressor HrcA [Bacillota bacterium]
MILALKNYQCQEGEKVGDRQKELLKIIVESYIKTCKPVGSKSLCDSLGLSSATIRNEMAILENLGYLEKCHISSGRIPSEEGYKYYVDNLMKPKELTGEDVLKLQTIFKNQDLALSDAINQCVEIISDITNYTSVVLGKNSSNNFLQNVSIVPLPSNKIVAVVCTNKGIVENKQFAIPETISIEELVKTSEIINKMLIGTPIDEVSQRLEFDIKPIISKKIKQYEAVYNIFHDAFDDFVMQTSNVHFSGKTKIFDQPEYNDVDEIKRLANKFEDDNMIKNIESEKDGINIYIGDENDFDENVTVVKSTYNVNGEKGTIAIIGPKRMEYDKVVGLLSYITENLERQDDNGE